MQSSPVRKVIDNSMLQSTDLLRYLSASRSHFAVLPDFVAIESYKVPSLAQILLRWEILSQFPRQALVLKTTGIVCGLRGRSRGLQARMIDQKQTAAFAEFCSGIERAKAGDPRYQRALLKLSAAAQLEIATVSAAVPDVLRTRKELAATYSPAEVRILRTGVSIPQSVRTRFVRNVCLLFWTLMTRHPSIRVIPKSFDDGCNLYLFRFSLCIHIWILEWIARGSNKQTNEAAVRNDLIDLHVATYGTYFDGLMTSDDKLARIHAMARRLQEEMHLESLPNEAL